jgi:hypothetical protein
MKKEQFEKEADECGMMDYLDLHGDSVGIKMILDMVNDAVAAEREACAKVCEEIYTGEEACGDWPTPEMCAAAIRTRRSDDTPKL